jgi:protein-disulfide isomerase
MVIVTWRYPAGRSSLRHNNSVKIHQLAPGFVLAALCLGQGTWQTTTDINGVDFQGLSPARREAALNFLRTETCTCGCNMKLAECRMKDPACGTSRKLANAAVKDFGAGKKVDEIRADLKKLAGEPPPILEAPVPISLAGDPVTGAGNARVTLVEFSDFQCPFCMKAVHEAKEILKLFPNDVRLVFKQFPLDSHRDAEFGAEAALAAQEQGKFWEMHDRLYAGYPDLSRRTIMKYAQQIGLDMKRFSSDLDSRRFQARVHREEQEGEKAGVEGTPTFFINGKKYNGIFDVASVAPLIRKEMK